LLREITRQAPYSIERNIREGRSDTLSWTRYPSDRVCALDDRRQNRRPDRHGWQTADRHLHRAGCAEQSAGGGALSTPHAKVRGGDGGPTMPFFHPHGW